MLINSDVTARLADVPKPAIRLNEFSITFSNVLGKNTVKEALRRFITLSLFTPLIEVKEFFIPPSDKISKQKPIYDTGTTIGLFLLKLVVLRLQTLPKKVYVIFLALVSD